MDQALIFNLPNFPQESTSFVAGTLGVRVAEKLRKKIRDDALTVGTRLPSEQAMATHFGVSRSVMREAIALLKSEGVLNTRKGSGAFLCAAPAERADDTTEQSVQSLLNLIEVRGGLESEIAALAALRRTPGQLIEIEHALRAIEIAVASGVDGVEKDVRFHMSIAEATGNPYWPKFVEMFAQPIRSAVKVTRANEARREDFLHEVQSEHEKIVDAIAAGNPELARTAAMEHMQHAAERVRLADREFWRGDGGALARTLAQDPMMRK